MDSENYSRTSVRGRTFTFQVLHNSFLRETQHDATVHYPLGLSPARTLPSAAAGALFKSTSARALSSASTGALL